MLFLNQLIPEHLKLLISILAQCDACNMYVELLDVIDRLKTIVAFSHWGMIKVEAIPASGMLRTEAFGNITKNWLLNQLNRSDNQFETKLVYRAEDIKLWLEGKKSIHFNISPQSCNSGNYIKINDFLYYYELSPNPGNKTSICFFNPSGFSWHERDLFRFLSPFFMKRLLSIEKQTYGDVLSLRQIQILEKIQYGMKRKQIADEICCSVANVKYHLHKIYQKLDVFNQASAVRKAINLGLINGHSRNVR